MTRATTTSASNRVRPISPAWKPTLSTTISVSPLAFISTPSRSASRRGSPRSAPTVVHATSLVATAPASSTPTSGTKPRADSAELTSICCPVPRKKHGSSTEAIERTPRARFAPQRDAGQAAPSSSPPSIGCSPIAAEAPAARHTAASSGPSPHALSSVPPGGWVCRRWISTTATAAPRAPALICTVPTSPATRSATASRHQHTASPRHAATRASRPTRVFSRPRSCSSRASTGTAVTPIAQARNTASAATEPCGPASPRACRAGASASPAPAGTSSEAPATHSTLCGVSRAPGRGAARWLPISNAYSASPTCASPPTSGITEGPKNAVCTAGSTRPSSEGPSATPVRISASTGGCPSRTASAAAPRLRASSTASPIRKRAVGSSPVIPTVPPRTRSDCCTVHIDDNRLYICQPS